MSETSFFRPGVKALIWRSREALIGLGIGFVGFVMAGSSSGITEMLGLALVIGGAILAFAGIQQARFRGRSGGVGVVQVTEGEIAYYGPIEGGVVSIQSLESLAIEPQAKPLHWVLSERGKPALMIPVNAEGADGLFDAFTSLPGIETEKMLALLKAPPAERVVIWKAG